MNLFFTIFTIIGLPLSIVGSFFDWNLIVLFIIYSITVIGLANFIRRSTESLAAVVGSSLGGLLNATFGNAGELIISFFALKEGLNTIVMASITGVVLVNLLFAGGLSFLAGGLRYKRQSFNAYEARHNAGLLMFAVIITFVFPFIFSYRLNSHNMNVLSTIIAIIVIITYILALLFKLVTHRGVYHSKGRKQDEQRGNEGQEEPEWGVWKAIIILTLTTIALAYVSEKLVGTIQPVGHSLGWSETFIGIIVVAIVGSAAEYVSAVYMALKDKMDVSIEISLGSTIQTAMFVAPVLLLTSWLFTFMPLVFQMTELVSMILAVFLTVTMTNDGDTNWLEGTLLLACYLIMGTGFYLL